MFCSCVRHRWRWSRTCWTTSCATNARERVVAESSPRSSAPTSPACSITASSAGRTSTPAPDASSTSRWSKREPTVPARSTSAGTKDGRAENVCCGEKKKRCLVWPPNTSCQYRVLNRIQYIENIYDYKYINISLSFVAARNTTSLSLFHQTTSFSSLPVHLRLGTEFLWYLRVF